MTPTATVAAAAGYGKTTALRGWYPSDTRWHRGLPKGRGEPAVVLAGIVAEEARAGARRVVFDDLPALPPGTPGEVARLVGGAAEVALASRWPLARADVGPAALSLSVDQVGELLTGYALEEYATELAERVHRLTAGWPALVHLAAETLRTGGVPHGPLLPVLAAPDGPIAGYLAEEVLPALAPEAAGLLARLGDLAPVGPELCAALGHPGAAPAIRLLTRGGLLTTAGAPPPVPGGPPPCPRIVPVVAEVAGGDDHSARAAVFFDGYGPPIAAALAFRRSGRLADCARVLRRHGRSMVARGQAATVAELVTALPDRDAELWLLLGDAHRAGGAPDAAARAYAAAGLPATDAGLAWRTGRIHYQRGDARAALAAFAAAGPGPHPPEDATLLSAWTANAHLLAGEPETALRHARAAVATAPEDGPGAATAHVSVALCSAALGDDAASEEHYALALPAAEGSGDVVLLTRIHINRTFRLLRAARFEPALATARTCAKYAAVAGEPSLRAIAACNEADALAMLGRFDEAVRQYERAIAGYRRIGSRRVAGALLGLGEVYRRRGWHEQARGAYERAIKVATEAGNAHVLTPAEDGLAMVLLDADPGRAAGLARPGTLADGRLALRDGDHGRAAEVAEKRCAAAREEDDRIGLADALELRGRAMAAAGDPGRAGAALRECHAIWAGAGAVVEAARVRVAIARLPGATADDRLRGLVAVERLRAAGAAAAAGPEQPGTDVEVQALGRFEVLVGGVPVPASRWQSRKARDLLRVLVARRGRPIPRDELGELLWPDDDPAKTSHRLSVLLSIVRGVLDPAKALPADHCLVADQGSVALDVTRVRVDVEDFLAHVAHARRLVAGGSADEARDLLAMIDRHHGGEAFEDEPYAAWSAALRAETRAAHLEMLRLLVQTAESVDRAVEHLLRLLACDPYDEAAHRGLVRRLVRAGRHGEARRAYDRYRSAMETIGVRPPDASLLSGRSRSAPPPS